MKYLQYVEELFTRFLSYKDFVYNQKDEDIINSCKRIVRIIKNMFDDSLDDLDELLGLFYKEIEALLAHREIKKSDDISYYTIIWIFI